MHSKRILDIVFAIIGLLIFSPVMLIVAFIIRCRLGRPVLFRQTRAGLGGKPFEIIKFRTMKDLRDVKGEILPDNQRISPFGKFLRSTSIDELPELINILKGEMSLVGPRPLLIEYLPLYSEKQMRRHEVLPGITGWAQINGRNAISWKQKFVFDVWYIDNQSTWLDLKIIFRTFWKVLKMTHINQQGQATVEPFNGNN